MKSRAAWSHRVLLFALALVSIHYCVSAQQASQHAGQSLTATASEQQAGNNFNSSFASAEFAFEGGTVVQGAPFSAVGVKETTQILSDGSRIVRRMTSSIYRDSEGRTRFEWGNDTKTPSAAHALMIFDSVGHATYFIDTRNHRALKLSSEIKDASLRQPKIFTPQSPPDDITRVVGETIEPLGTEMIEGIKADGVRVTSTVPATEPGGKQLGKVVFERWYSQELRRTVLIKCTDPRFGEAVFRLTDIDRSEPASELFTIPAGYQIDTFPTAKPARTLKSSYLK